MEMLDFMDLNDLQIKKRQKDILRKMGGLQFISQCDYDKTK